MLYARKLNEDAWFDNSSDKNEHHIDSDSATDLQTKGHELSVWQVSDDKHNIDDIALAIALTRNEVKGFYLALLNPINLKSNFDWDVAINEQKGKSVINIYNDEHRNFMVYTLDEIGFLATQIHKQYLSSSDFVYYSETKLTMLLSKAIENKILEANELKSNNLKKWATAYEKYKSSLEVPSK